VGGLDDGSADFKVSGGATRIGEGDEMKNGGEVGPTGDFRDLGQREVVR